MSGKQYLKNQLPVLLLNLLGVLALALFLIATGTSRQAISFIALVWIVVVVCYLTVSFFIQKRNGKTAVFITILPFPNPKIIFLTPFFHFPTIL